MNEDNLNMEIRKFLKKTGIASQRFIENEINIANKNHLIKPNNEIYLEMELTIKTLNKSNIIKGKIKID